MEGRAHRTPVRCAVHTSGEPRASPPASPTAIPRLCCCSSTCAPRRPAAPATRQRPPSAPAPHSHLRPPPQHLPPAVRTAARSERRTHWHRTAVADRTVLRMHCSRSRRAPLPGSLRTPPEDNRSPVRHTPEPDTPRTADSPQAHHHRTRLKPSPPAPVSSQLNLASCPSNSQLDRRPVEQALHAEGSHRTLAVEPPRC